MQVKCLPPARHTVSILGHLQKQAQTASLDNVSPPWGGQPVSKVSHSLFTLGPSTRCSLEVPVCTFQPQYFTCAFPPCQSAPQTTNIPDGGFPTLETELKGPSFTKCVLGQIL